MNPPNLNPYAPPLANVTNSASSDVGVDISRLAISDTWKARFLLIQKAGGPKLPLLKTLPADERRKVMGFNLLGFLFGPIYYAAKGMWRKGISLCLLAIVLILTLEFVLGLLGYGKIGTAASYGVGAIYAVRANIDYYKKMVLGKNDWW